jgi:cytochrome c5
MKKFLPFLSICLFITIASCNSSGDKPAEETKATTIDTVASVIQKQADTISTTPVDGASGKSQANTFCHLCQCHGFTDTDGDKMCNSPRVDNPTTICDHHRRDHN